MVLHFPRLHAMVASSAINARVFSTICHSDWSGSRERCSVLRMVLFLSIAYACQCVTCFTRFAIVFNIVNQFKLKKQLRLQESTFIPSASMVQPNLPEATSIQLSRNYIHGARLYLPDLTRDLTAVIKNKHFDRCVIYGPAIISPISGCHIQGNQFACSEGNSSDLFHEISDERKEIIGIIGLIDCKFTNCWFRGVALAGNLHLRNQFEIGKHLPPVNS